MTQFAELWSLQETDVALDSRRASIADAEARLDEPEELIAARAKAAEHQEALARVRAQQKEVEVEADDLRAKIAPLETKLYSGSIKNPKELADLQADIDALKRHVSAVEDRDLEALSAVESAEEEARVAAAELSALEASWGEEQSELRERIERLGAEVTVLEARRGEQAGAIDRDLLRTYDRLRTAHQGRGAAKLERNLCTGCRISLPVNLVNRARAGTALVQCPNCERILVV